MESAMPEKSRLEWLALHKAWVQAATTTDAVAKKHFANLILTSATFHDRVAALLKMSKSAMSAKGSFLGAAAIDKLRVAVLVSNVAVELVSTSAGTYYVLADAPLFEGVLSLAEGLKMQPFSYIASPARL